MTVSIIVPVYNVENYLSKCLDSLINQTYKDIQIICVNDGSTDNSSKILYEYAQKDSRIKIAEKENGGLFSARHEGMKYVDGDYILFVDSDDYVDRTLVEKCVNTADADIVVFGAFSVKKDKITSGGYGYSKIPCKYFKKTFNKDDFGKDIFKFPPTAWSKMYRTSFIKENNIRFQEIRNGEDQLFFIHSMLTAKKIAVIPENLYYYLKTRKGAITAVNKKTSLSPILNCYETEKLLSDLNIEENFKTFIVNKYFEKSLSWYTKADEDIKDEFYTELIKLQAYLSEKYRGKWWKNLNIKQKESYYGLKFKVLLAKIGDAK